MRDFACLDFAKVFSQRSAYTTCHKTFLPQNFPGIWYTYVVACDFVMKSYHSYAIHTYIIKYSTYVCSSMDSLMYTLCME